MGRMKCFLIAVCLGSSCLLLYSVISEYKQKVNECRLIKEHCEKCCGTKITLLQCMAWQTLVQETWKGETKE